MKHDGLSDKELIELYLKNDENAFEVLYQRYRKPLYSYLNKMLPGQPALVDDLFQQTWMKVIKSLERYKDSQNFLAWCIRIGRNLSIDYFRKENKKSMVNYEDISLIEGGAGPLQSISESELGQAIGKAVATLPSDQQEVFVLRQQNLSFKEIAEIQNTSLNTTLGRMHYAVNKLRKILKDWL